MLQSIRSHTSGIVVQILFGVLILTFALWGIGDIFRGHGPDTSVATVGDQEIPAQEVSDALHEQIDRLRAELHASLTPDQIKELGLLDSTMRNVINRHLLSLEANRLGLAVNDDAVRQAIIGNPAFRGSSGTFDRRVYAQLLNANHMTDQQYEALLRSDLVRNRIVASVTAAAKAPPEMVDALWHSRDQRRVATAVVIPPAAVGEIAAPDAKTLEKFYKAHQNQFMLPARRSFTVALIDPARSIDKTTIPEDQLKAAYAKRKSEFMEPEKRVLEQILVKDEAKAKAAAAALAAGKDFATVAQQIAGQKPDTIKLGAMARNELPGALGKAVFDLKVGGVTKPMHDPFGWHIVKVVGTVPPAVTPFAKVKDKLAAQLKRDRAADQAANIANKIDDASAGGATFKDVVAKFKLRTVTIDGVDAKGHDAKGKAVKLPAASDAILKTAFATSPDQPSDLKDLPDQGYYMVKVDHVFPAAPQPLKDIHDKVVKAWQKSEHDARLAKLAQEMAGAVNKGQKLADLAALHGFKTFTTKPLSRGDTDGGLPATVMAKLFAAKKGQAVSGAGTDEKGTQSEVVAVVKTIVPPDPAREKQQKSAIAQEIEQSTKGDLLHEYEQALRQRYPVTINKTRLNNLL